MVRSSGYYPRWMPNGPALLLLTGLFLCAPAVPQSDRERSFTLYGGRLTDDNWHTSLEGEADWADAYLLVGALSRTFYRSPGRWWSLELEGSLGRYFGDQDHWEFNGPVVTARWHRFPWSNTLDTGLAFGLGLSYAGKIPAVEAQLDGSSERLLLYWHIETSLGPPGRDWDVIFRLHHRSTAYGLFGEAGGGNTLTTGLRLGF